MPVNLTPGGSGFFSITTTRIPDAVTGRSYTVTITTSAVSPSFVSLCTFSGNVPPGLTGTASGPNCELSMTAAPAAKTYNFTLTVRDNSNPPKTDSRPYTLVIRPEFSIAMFSLVDGITGRSYTRTITVQTNLSDNTNPAVTDYNQPNQFGNGPLNPVCSVTGLPPPFTSGGGTASCAPNGTGVAMTVILTAPTGTLVAGVSAITITATDTPIRGGQSPPAAAVPAKTWTNTTQPINPFPLSLTVRKEFTITPFTTVDGIAGRTYTRTFTVGTDLANSPGNEVGQASEFGNGPVTTCAVSGLPTGFTGAGGTATCAPDATGVNMTVKLAAPNGSLLASVSNIILTATDTPIRTADQSSPVVPSATFTNANQSSPFVATLTVRPEFSITGILSSAGTSPFVMLDGIQNRSYTRTFTLATNLSNNPSNETGQASEFGNGPLTGCLVNGLPSAFTGAGGKATCAPDSSGVNMVVALAAPTSALVAGVNTVTVAATDSPILELPQTSPVVPNNTMSTSTTYTIRKEFSITEPPLVDSIQGRTYTKPITTNLVASPPSSSVGDVNEFGNGPATTCQEGTGNLANLGLAIGVDSKLASRCLITGAAKAGAGTTVPLTIQVTDMPILASDGTTVVPANTIALANNLTVRNEFQITQSSLADGVQGRSYGTGACAGGKVCVQPEQTNVTTGTSSVGQQSEFGNGPLTLCTLTSVAPSNPNLGALVDATNNRCLLQSTAVGAAGSYTVIVSATDSPIIDPDTASVAVPANTISSASALPLKVNPVITFSLNFDSAAGQPGMAPNAVQGRTYGAAPQSPPDFNAAGGLIATTGLTFNLVSGTLPTPITCPSLGKPLTPASGSTSVNLTCSSSGLNVSVSSTQFPAAFPFTLQVGDPGNTATPPGANSTDLNGHASHTISVEAQISVNPNLPSPFPAGVADRPYGSGTGCSGTGGSCTALVYTASGGLGSAQAIHGGSPGGYNFTASGFPTGFSPMGCTASANTLTCLSVGAAGAAQSYSPKVSVTDNANATTPGGNPTTDPNSVTTGSLTINSQLGVTPPTSGSLANAVTGRSYGQGMNCGPAGNSNCAPIDYGVAGGLGTYPSSLPLATLAGSFNCSFTAGMQPLTGTYSCSTAKVTAIGPTAPTLTITVSDSANITTPSGSKADSSVSLTINPEMSFPSSPGNTFPAAVTASPGRPYGSGMTCGTGATPCVPLSYTVAAGSGNGAYSFSNKFPTGFVSCSPSGNLYTCSSTTGVTAIAGTYPNLIVTVSDTANTSTPANSVPSTPASLTINPEITLTPPGTVPVAITTRSYGAGTGCPSGVTPCQPLQYRITGGLGNYQQGSLSDGKDTLSCPVASGTYSCSTSASNPIITQTVSPSILTLSAPENGNTATPAHTATDSTKTITINPEMSLTPPAGAVSVAVTGRSYGAGTGCPSGVTPCQPLQYGITGGLGNYQQGSLSDGKDTLSCPVASGTYSCSTSTSNPTITQTVSPSILTLSAPENGNTATPAHAATDSTKTITINPEMSLTPPAAVPAAVTGRAYGTGSGCFPVSACATLNYSIAGGLGNYQMGTLSDGKDTLNCPVTLPSGPYSCSIGALTQTVSGSKLTMSAPENGNTATPAHTATDSTKTITIHPEMSLTPPAAVAAAVTGRAYGTGTGCFPVSACATLNYSIAGGLGNYQMGTLSDGKDILNCPVTLPGGPYSCSTATSVPPNITQTNGSFTLTMSAPENGNASTPGHTAPDNSKTIGINPQMSLTPPGTVPVAVTGRPYGAGTGCFPTSTCAALLYGVTGGLGNYVPGTLGDGKDTLNCPVASATYSCSTATSTPAHITQTSGSFTLTMNAPENGNTSTPGISVPDTSKSLTINAGISLTQSLGTTWPDGVQNRTYGTGSACGVSGTSLCSPAVYTASNGLSPYVWPSTTPASFPTGLTCTASASTYTCTAPGPSGITGAPNTYQPTVAVTDTANASTPAATTTTDPNSTLTDTLLVEGPLAIGAEAPPNGLVDLTYDTPSAGFQLTTTGGLTGLTWLEPASTPARACTSSPTGTIPPGLAVGASSGLLSGTPTTASASVTDYTFQVCVTDTANTSTPAGFALPPNPPFTGNDYVLNVMDTLAYVAEPGVPAVEVIRTSNSIGTVTSVATAAAPDSVALTPNGRQAYVTLANNKFAVIDTITNAQITGSPFSLPAACTGPLGVAISPDGTRAYFACSTSSKVVVISTADNTTVVATITAAGSPTPTTPDSVAFKSDGTRAYVTFSGTNQVVILNNTASPPVQVGTAFALTAANTTPLGIALATNGADTYAYVAKQNPGNPGAVDVVNVTTDTLSIVTNITSVGASGSEPDSVAVTPDGTNVFVTLTGVDQFAVIDNTKATPVQITGSPFNLPDPGSASTASAPIGVAIPPLTPVPGSGFRVFISLSAAAAHEVAIIDSSPPTKDSASPISLAAGAAPSGIANIPAPQ